jgi:hypothetical protein
MKMAPAVRDSRITNVIRSFDQSHGTSAGTLSNSEAVLKFQALQKRKSDRSGQWQAQSALLIQDVKIPGGVFCLGKNPN